MSGSWEPDGSTPVDANTFQEWVRHTADSRDIDEQELLNQLVSAFWVLDEMTDVVPQSDMDANRRRGDNESDGVTPSELDDKGRPEQRSDPSISDSDSREVSETQSETRPFDPSETDSDSNSPVDKDDPSATAADSSTSDVPTDDPGMTEIQELRDSMNTQLNLVQAVAELRQQVSDLSYDVEQQRSRQDNFTDRISDDLTRLHSRVEALESQTGELDDALVDRLDALEEHVDDLKSSNRDFEAWIDEEFDEIEGLFERLIERTDRLDNRLDDVESTAETVDQRRGDLVSLRQEAIDVGVDSGRCESCDSLVDLSMLMEPFCPTCDNAFTGIDPGLSWYPFSRATLRTRPPDSP